SERPVRRHLEQRRTGCGALYQINWHEKRMPASPVGALFSLGPAPHDERKSIPAGIDFQYLQVWTAMREGPAKCALLACGSASIQPSAGVDRDEERSSHAGICAYCGVARWRLTPRQRSGNVKPVTECEALASSTAAR